MIITREYTKGTWLDVSSPSKDELDSLMLSHNIDPNTARDLLTPTPNQYTKEIGDVVYLVFHIPVFGGPKKEIRETEIDCVISKNDLISVRYESIDPIHYFAKQIEVEEVLNKSNYPHAFTGMTKEVYKFLEDELSYIDSWLKDIEQNIFSGKEKDMVLVISAVSRNLLSFRRIIIPHKQIWQNMHSIIKERFGQEFVGELRAIMEQLDRIIMTADNLTLLIDEFRETNNSILSTKQNEIMKIFTIMAFVTFPLSLITSIFGMATESTPIIGTKYDFWIIMSIMFGATLAMFTFFRYKKWL